MRTIAGTMDIHLELERRLAAFKGVEAAITFQSGLTANLATIPAPVGKEDVIFSDELNHASIIDGARLSGARIVRFAHADPLDLEQAIKSNEGTYRRALIVTDGGSVWTVTSLPWINYMRSRTRTISCLW